ncbi:hypothetical protein [Nannocystis bainbridge]|uniref:Uncharacterized protein n=1 Tax=Nannocystis bainbridge TaxID=2995303 RepID=A0ABT5ECH6_9BACT|nr:hypothetical protein [Nannocystis bainbridge]MDC0723561.1 hypothetical protein [Nannocystis bainbridge]
MTKLICTLEMSKERGVTITVEDAEGKIVQTITMNGTTLVAKVKGEQEETSLTQTTEKVTISCKQFEVVARESITCTATKTATYESKEGNTTVKSGADVVQQAQNDFKVSGANVAIKAQSAAKIEGATVEASGTQSIKLKGNTQAELAGMQVAVKADAQLSLESSGMAALKGSMTTIGGSLIKAG